MRSFEFVAQAALSEESIEDAIGNLRTVLLYTGTIAFAISAALLAGRRRMGIFGVVVFGVIVANGGAPAIASSIAATFIFTLRLLSIHLDWGFARFTIDEDQDGSGSR